MFASGARSAKAVCTLAAVALLATGCYSSELPGAGYAKSPTFRAVSSPYSDPPSDTNGASPVSLPPSAKIVLRECAPGDDETVVVLGFYDPTLRSPTEYRAFKLPPTKGANSAVLCNSPESPAAQRSAFNTDYTKLAVVATNTPANDMDNSSQVVVVTGSALSTTRPKSASSNATPATVVAPDLLDAPAYSGPAFGPDGRVYFRKTNLDGTFAFQSVAPGSTAVRNESTPANMRASDDGGLYFLPGCSLPQEFVVEQGACTSDGKTEFSNMVWGTEPQVRAGGGTPYTVVTPGDSNGYPNAVWPFGVLGPNSFVAGANGSAMYVVKPGAKASEFDLSQIVAAPADVEFTDPALSPGGKTIAALARSGQLVYLGVVPVSPGGEFEQVTQFTIGQNMGTMVTVSLLGWLPAHN